MSCWNLELLPSNQYLTSSLPSAILALLHCSAGFIVDYGRDGWGTGTPPFSGDYFVPGSPAEGWVAEWTEGSTSFNTVNKGLMQQNGMMPPTHIEITSHENKQASFWVGKTGNLRVSKVTQFSDSGSASTDDLHFSTSVTLKNEGTSPITNLYYMRTVDPDQEQEHTGKYATSNWVDSQRFVNGETPSNRAEGPTGSACTSAQAANGECTNKCFVAAVGQTYAATYCGLGAINSHCRVNHWGFNNNDASDSWANTLWQSHSEGNRRNWDEAIQLHFFYETIQPGATVQFNYAYVLGAAALDPAMQALDFVSITSPTDVISGVYALFQAEIAQEALAGGGIPTRADFYIYAMLEGAGLNAWHPIESITTKPDGGALDSTSRTFSSTVLVPNDYEEGVGQLKVVIALDDGSKYDQQMVVEITEGVAMCWDLNLDNNGEVRRSKERSDELTAVAIPKKIAHTYTSIQDAPPQQPPQ